MDIDPQKKQLNWFLTNWGVSDKQILNGASPLLYGYDKQASFHSDGNRQSTFAGHVQGPHSSNNKIK